MLNCKSRTLHYICLKRGKVEKLDNPTSTSYHSFPRLTQPVVEHFHMKNKQITWLVKRSKDLSRKFWASLLPTWIDSKTIIGSDSICLFLDFWWWSWKKLKIFPPYVIYKIKLILITKDDLFLIYLLQSIPQNPK